MPQTNIYVGIEPRISFDGIDELETVEKVQDWLDARFPNGIFNYDCCKFQGGVIETFYDSHHRFWSVITRLTDASN